MTSTKFSPLLVTSGRHGPSHTKDALDGGRRPRLSSYAMGAVLAAALLLVFLVTNGRAPSDAQELAWLSRLAASGNPDAQLQLGLAYREGRYGLVPDAASGRYWLQKAAGNGQRYAADELAGESAAGASRTKGHDRVDALARQQNPPTLGTISALWKVMGLGLTAGQSAASLEAKAQGGDPVAEYQLAMRYRDGAWSVRRDAAKAFYWLQHAADDGNPVAMQTLSDVYRAGALGAARDLDKAAHWRERAAAVASRQHG